MRARPLWTSQELVAATGGELRGEVTVPMNGVSIDSRGLVAGDIFVAIKGDAHDGHAFAAQALRAGAAVAVVSHIDDEMLASGPVLHVVDPLQSLEKMGRAARQWNNGQFIAVTGSVGKTSTKEMLRVALSASGNTHASAASFNNHWGVPLTLARLPRNAAFGVFEIGMNHAGEITPLVALVQPNVAIITTIAASHIGHFNSLDEIAEAKAEIFSGVAEGAAAVINRDTPYFDVLAKRARQNGIKKIISFGKHVASDVRLKQVALHPTCSCISADVMGEAVTFKLGTPGQHMAVNSLGVLAAVKLVGADLARASLALSEAKPAQGRGGQELLQLPSGDVLLLDESYNANPQSMAAAFELLAVAAKSRKGRRIAVLGDMLELGEFGIEMHRGLASELNKAKINSLYAAGPMMKHLWNSVAASQQAAYANASTALIDQLAENLRGGDSVVIKGSLGSKMGLIGDALRQRFAVIQKEGI